MNLYRIICGTLLIICIIFNLKYLGIIIVSVNTTDSLIRYVGEIKSKYRIRKAINQKLKKNEHN